MQVQGINEIKNNSTNFGAIMSFKVVGRDFKRNPEMAQKILMKFMPKDTFAYEGSIAKAVLKSKDYTRFSTQMIYGTDMPYNNSISLLVYEKPDGNMLARTWKYIKASLAYAFDKEKSSEAYIEVAPSELFAFGDSFEEAANEFIDKLDHKQIPSKFYYINRIIH